MTDCRQLIRYTFPMWRLIITLDGPAGSGKSTVAWRLAKRLGVTFLDTGAMYRAMTAACLSERIDPVTQLDAVMALSRRIRLRFDWQSDPPRLQLDCGDGFHDISDRLRRADVTRHVSQLASIPEVRQILVESQRQIGAEHPRLVTEGRDQGSVVFPDADVKFYLDASPHVRARRRTEQYKSEGQLDDEQRILDDLHRRDHLDSTRVDGPLLCPEDAIRIDNSELTLEQVVDQLEGHVCKYVGQRGGYC